MLQGGAPGDGALDLRRGAAGADRDDDGRPEVAVGARNVASEQPLSQILDEAAANPAPVG